MIDQIATIDPQAADWLANLCASIDATTADPGKNWRGALMGAFSKAQLNDAERHLLCLASCGHESSNDLTPEQCKALAYWIDDGGDKLVGRICAAVLKAQGQAELSEVDPVVQTAVDELGAELRQKGETEMDKAKTVDPKKQAVETVETYTLDNPEALFSASIKMYDPSGADVMITIRDELVPGDTAAAKAEACAKLVSYLTGKGWRANGNGHGKATASHPMNVEPPPAPAATPPAPQAGGNGGTGNIEHIDKVLVTAPSGKPQVEFWRSGRKYPELKWNLGGASLLEIAPTLAAGGWTAEHFDTVGAEYPMNLEVAWTPSPKNPKWKDVTGVKLVA